jgi:UDP-GlcNAc:undecaprenyl-phosphate/decaprenyl-phosphate GlcNAc-1-phosphate transferase
MKIIPLIVINLLTIFFINKFRIIISQKLRLVDIPDKIRKFHKSQTPLLGGMMIFTTLILLNIYMFLFDQYNKVNLIIFISSSLCFLLGLIDDILKLSYKYKLALLSLFFSFFIILEPNLQITKIYFFTFDKFVYLNDFSILFTVICLLSLSNAINLIDGINGLCVLISVIILSWILITFQDTNFIYIIIISLILILAFNLKNYVFLGDSGSLLLGSFIGFLVINNYNNEIVFSKFPVENIFIVLMIPGIDMLRVFILRLLKNKNPFSSDRNHLHYLLLDKKIALYKTLLIILSLCILPIIINTITNIRPIIIIIFSIIIYAFFIKIIKSYNVNVN